MVYDLIIIGMGPVGLWSLYFSGLNDLKVLGIEIDENIGGKAYKLFGHKEIFDFPGYKSITGNDLINNLYEQAKTVSDYWNMITNTNIKTIIKNPITKIFSLTDTNKNIYKSKNILLTTGIGAFTCKKPTFKYPLNRKIDFYPQNLQKYKNQDVIVCGGGNSAVEFAIALNKICNSVKLFHHRDKFTCFSHLIDQLKETSIELYLNTEILEIDNTNLYYEIKGINNQLNCKYENIIFFYGLQLITTNLSKSDFLNKQNKLVVDENCMSITLPGFYGAGGILSQNQIDLIFIGMADACKAITSISNISFRNHK